MKKKRFIVLGTLVLVVIVGAYLIFFSDIGGRKRVMSSEPIRTEPLSEIERQKVISALGSSKMLDDMPKSGVIGLRFYSFDEDGRVWRDGFLLGKGGLVGEGEPEIFVAVHAKYIEEFEGSDLCEVIKEANRNGDLAYDLIASKLKLTVKYSGMMKYRKCFG